MCQLGRLGGAYLRMTGLKIKFQKVDKMLFLAQALEEHPAMEDIICPGADKNISYSIINRITHIQSTCYSLTFSLNRRPLQNDSWYKKEERFHDCVENANSPKVYCTEIGSHFCYHVETISA